MSVTPGTIPEMRGVFREQIASVALSVRREVIWGVVAMCVLTAFVMVAIANSGQQVAGEARTILPDWEVIRRERLIMISSVTMVLGLFAPMSFWKDMAPTRRSYFWSLPVDRRAHSIARALAGWLVLLAIFAVFFLWSSEGRLGGLIARDGQWWFCLVPFAAGSAAYFLGTAITLLSDRPWLWYAGGAVLFVMYAGLLTLTWNPALKRGYAIFIGGDHGVTRLLSGHAVAVDPMLVETFQGVVRYESDPQIWLMTAALWGLSMLAILWLSNRRFLER